MRMMEWENQKKQNGNGNGNGNGVGLIYVKVMTDEQMEILRKQIAAYATICDQLVQMHKSLTTHHDLTGVRFGNMYCDPLMASSGQKISARQRWNPTPVQLQILEQIFEEGNGTPSKQKIKDITSQLIQHGQISETNVYNWFQNRRARSKRKQSVAGPNNAESEVEIEVESPKEKKTKTENSHSSEQAAASRVDDLCSQKGELNSLGPQSNKTETISPPDDSLKPLTSSGQISFYESDWPVNLF